MRRTFIFISLLSICAMAMSSAQSVLNGAEYEIYFHNNETQLLQYRNPGEVLLGAALSGNGTNVQLGYSPIKYLSLDAGYLSTLIKARNDVLYKDKQAYSFALGTYYFFRNKTNSKSQANTEKNKYHPYGILISSKIGFSYNSILTKVALENFTPSPTSNFTETELLFHTYFANLSMAYQYSWGLLTITAAYQILDYKKGKFSGNFVDTQKLSDIAAQLREASNYNIFSIGFHNEFGTRSLRLLAGGTFPLIYFQNFKNQAGEIEIAYVYVGLMLHIDQIFKFGKSKNHK